MRREKFIFNTQTLRYERVVEPLSYTLLRIFGFVCAAVFTAFVLTLLTHRYFPSPTENLLLTENEQLAHELADAESKFQELSTVLENLQKRDAYAHRMIFGMEPIDENVWIGGQGGHDANEDLRQFKYTGEKMAQLREQIDRLRHQMVLQSRSLDTITMMSKKKEDMLAAIPSIKPVRSDKLKRNLNYLSGFGYRIHPIHKVRKMHYGIDFTAPSGTPIQATGAGKVVKAGYHGGFGQMVLIEHNYGYQSLYAHMSKVSVKVGDEVVRGQQIGLIGSTGQSTGSHCHYEVIKNGVKVDPIQYCTDGLTPEEYQELVKAARVSNQSFD